MKILITGAEGFIAKNLIELLKRANYTDLLLFHKETSENVLETFIQNADFIFHLAGVNRPKSAYEFYEGNTDLTAKIIALIKKRNRTIPILFTSSTQAMSDNDYGKSKHSAEILIQNYSNEVGASAYIYRLPNVFGKWGKPDYNSVISTWCHNITRDIPIQINNPSKMLDLVYIGDVVSHFLNQLNNHTLTCDYYDIRPTYQKSLGEISQLLEQFKVSRNNLLIPKVGQGFERALYATYLSYLPENAFSYELKGHKDDRGTFYEILKTVDSGQFSLSTTKPGITRGNHYHNTKNEKFLVVKGKALIELRNIYSDEVIRYYVSDETMEVVEMVVGYTHNITNIGDTEMILLIWANEMFDSKKPDTNFLAV
jgi:UDP-2-acetamido-2,6-beta-L-arabino-hexul-4-ose reductase